MKTTGSVVLVVASLTAVAWGQSLEELAQKEKARRSKASAAAKTYSNDDLAKPSPSPSPTADGGGGSERRAPPRGYMPSGPIGGGRADGAGSSEAASGGGTSVGDAGAEDYWRDRFKAAEAGIRAAQKEVALARAKVDRSRKSVGQPLPSDGIQQLPLNPMLKPPELEEAEAQLAVAQTSLADAEKALDDVREEARRKGVPAGWLR